jgi:hypothetical protein
MAEGKKRALDDEKGAFKTEHYLTYLVATAVK